MSFLGNAIEFYVMHNSTHYPKTLTQLRSQDKRLVKVKQKQAKVVGIILSKSDGEKWGAEYLIHFIIQVSSMSPPC